uniref:Skp1_POZ domain-containing protein n=1 Tax=Panagrellus redivivus TaxID=6233 RepID=A0A7E5A2E9_PANRE
MASIIVNLPETIKIRTSDNEVLMATGKLINESEVLKKAFEMQHSPEADEIPVPVESASLKKALEFLEYFDLDEPYTPDLNREIFEQANVPAMKFLAGMPEADKVLMQQAIDILQCNRLADCLLLFILDALNKQKVYQIRDNFFGDCDSYTEED